MTILRAFYAGLRPEPIITVSEWSDRHRILDSTSAQPGKWRTIKTPYLKKIMDRLSSFDPCKKVIVIKGAQLGFTQSGLNFVGCMIDNSPAPILYVMPTEPIAKKMSTTKLDSMIKASPRLLQKIAPSKSRDKGNTILRKDFYGGFLNIAGANSAAGLRSDSIKYIVLDEVDAYPLDLDGEGSPVDLAEARTRTFAKKKIYLLSTPIDESTSVIEKEFLATSQEYFFVPCPHCGSEQTLKFEQLIYPEGDPKTWKEEVKYQCEHCAELIDEIHKSKMLRAGQWRSTKPELDSAEVCGFHINSLYSPFGGYTWTDVAKDFVRSENDVPKRKVFVNTVLGETWKDKRDEVEHTGLYNRAGGYKLNHPPKGVGFLTAGVDIQRNRIEVEIVGWGKNRQSWSVDYRVFYGNTNESPVWDQLEATINEKWIREDGLEMPLLMTCIDSGHIASEVYQFARKFGESKVFPIKGQHKQTTPITAPKQVDITIDGKKVGAVRIVHVGVSMLKSELYGQLRLRAEAKEDGPSIYPKGYCYFPEHDEKYFKMLTAEVHKEVVDKYGAITYKWVLPSGARNESLDCRVYARAAAAIVGLDRMTNEMFDALEQRYGMGSSDDKPKPKPRGPSVWDKF